MLEPIEKGWRSLSKIGLSEPKLFPYLEKILYQARSTSILGHRAKVLQRTLVMLVVRTVLLILVIIQIKLFEMRHIKFLIIIFNFNFPISHATHSFGKMA